MSEFPNTIVKACNNKLPKEWIKTLSVPGRPPLSYIGIDKTIKFFNDNFGDHWSVEIISETWLPTSVPAVSIRLNLTIMNKDGSMSTTRSGVGSDVHKPGKSGKNPVDPDKLVKTAYANAFKKASNMFGFGAELWDESNVEDNSEETSTAITPPKEESKPAELSPESKTAVGNFLKETGLSKDDLSEFLKEYKPESGGNPIILAHGDQVKNLDEFFAYVKNNLK